MNSNFDSKQMFWFVWCFLKNILSLLNWKRRDYFFTNKSKGWRLFEISKIFLQQFNRHHGIPNKLVLDNIFQFSKLISRKVRLIFWLKVSDKFPSSKNQRKEDVNVFDLWRNKIALFDNFLLFIANNIPQIFLHFLFVWNQIVELQKLNFSDFIVRLFSVTLHHWLFLINDYNCFCLIEE